MENLRTETRKKEIGEEIENLEQFLRENIRKVYAVINLVRHGHTNYTERYPDLTNEGKEKVAETATQLIQSADNLDKLAQTEQVPNFKQHVLFVSSPKARARASNKIIETKFRENEIDNTSIIEIAPDASNFDDDGVVRERKSIRAMDMYTFNTAMRLLVSEAKGQWSQRIADYIAATSDIHEQRRDVWESRSQIRHRSFQALYNASKVLQRYREKFQAIPRVIATSHFEVLNPLLIEVFKLSVNIEDDELLNRAEGYSIYLLQSEDKIHVPMVISFRDRAKKVVFNLKTLNFQ